MCLSSWARWCEACVCLPLPPFLAGPAGHSRAKQAAAAGGRGGEQGASRCKEDEEETWPEAADGETGQAQGWANAKVCCAELGE